MPQQRREDPTRRYGPDLSPMCSPWSREGALGNDWAAFPGTSDGAATSLNRAFYYPIFLPVMGTAYKFWWLNGATVGTNNIQVGLYADTGAYLPGAAILRGTSTLSAGASVVQFDASIAATLVGPGLVWLAIWFNGTTATVRCSTDNRLRLARQYEQSSLSGGLPTTTTPAAASGNRTFIFGIQFRPSP